MSEQTIDIAGRKIGTGCPVFVVAELSGNHRQQLDEALKLVRTAKQCGADAVKLQTYTADTITIRSDQPHFRARGETPWQGEQLYELYARACTPWNWYPQLRDAAASEGLILFSTPFDPSAVQFLERMDVPAYKIASFELVDLPLIRCVAATGKPLILSTGMASADEIAAAVQEYRSAGESQLALLKCTSAYPAPVAEANLAALATLRERFGVPVGISDHTMDAAIAAAAVALGATIVEKHLTLSRAAGGPDASFSLEPDEFAGMVRAVRTVEAAIGQGELIPTASEEACRGFRRSLFVVSDVRTGDVFDHNNVRSIRPADGLAPRYLPVVLGRRAKCDIARGTPLSWELIDEGQA